MRLNHSPWRSKRARGFALGVALAGLSACASNPSGPIGPQEGAPVSATMRPYQVGGVWYYPKAQPDYDRQGVASWYGAAENHHRTASGEVFDRDIASAAHTTLPIPSLVEVTNLDNGKRIQVRVNDRGPFVHGRIIDLSRQAAKDLGFYQQGMARVRVRYIGPAPRGRYVQPASSVETADVSSVPF